MITSITRDWGSDPAIVRIVTTDDYETVLGSTYLADQAANIKDVNGGAFEWKDGDAALVYNADGTNFMSVSVDASDKTLAVLNAPESGAVQSITFTKEGDDGAAATATAETPILSAPNGAIILNARYNPSAALTADNTDYATLTVARRDAAGANPEVIAAITTEITGTGDWVAFVAEDFAPLANTAIEAGGAVTFEIEKAGSGVVVPAGSLQVDYVAL
jgi:hypothetical protein